MNDSYDTAIIVSADSDLIPAIKTVKKIYPNKKIGILIPINRTADELKNIVDFYMKIKEKHLKSCQFPNVININNIKIQKPDSW